eukprot:TRINITY_DN17176_c0_g1_i1.p1 TRINITY_DN17176_c0_g1~~TRINITY_DN17176_c0_g1_i1.p1  ORF type:complete len:363 (+),score=115.97 TRINITY_DN17176_c0_g1_i1:874-1962(+)
MRRGSLRPLDVRPASIETEHVRHVSRTPSPGLGKGSRRLVPLQGRQAFRQKTESAFMFKINNMGEEDVKRLNERIRRSSQPRLEPLDMERLKQKEELRALLQRPKADPLNELRKLWLTHVMTSAYFNRLTHSFLNTEVQKRRREVRASLRAKILRAVRLIKMQSVTVRNAMIMRWVLREKRRSKEKRVAMIRKYLEAERTWNKLRYSCMQYHKYVKRICRIIHTHSILRRSQVINALEQWVTLARNPSIPIALRKRLLRDRIAGEHRKYAAALTHYNTLSPKEKEINWGTPPYLRKYLSADAVQSVIETANSLVQLPRDEANARVSIQTMQQIEFNNIASSKGPRRARSRSVKRGPHRAQRI